MNARLWGRTGLPSDSPRSEQYKNKFENRKANIESPFPAGAPCTAQARLWHGRAERGGGQAVSRTPRPASPSWVSAQQSKTWCCRHCGTRFNAPLRAAHSSWRGLAWPADRARSPTPFCFKDARPDRSGWRAQAWQMHMLLTGDANRYRFWSLPPASSVEYPRVLSSTPRTRTHACTQAGRQRHASITEGSFSRRCFRSS